MAYSITYREARAMCKRQFRSRTRVKNAILTELGQTLSRLRIKHAVLDASILAREMEYVRSIP